MKFAARTLSITSRIRFGITLIILVTIISSSAVMLFRPQYVLANPRVTDTSNSHSTLPLSEHSSPSMSSLGTPTTQAALQIPRTLQSTDLVNSLAFYEVTFITSTTGAIDKIRMDFPTETNIAAAGVIERVGIGGGTLLKSGSSVTFDVTAPASIPAGTFIRLEMFGIKNPPVPDEPSLTATITTRDSSGNLIDGPSITNAYFIRQIGTNDIAVNAVTSQKLADGSVTSTKPAESFMKSVRVADNAAGNAVGWNPDGVADDFQITEPAVGFDSQVSVSVEAFGSPSCHAWPMGSVEGIFNMQCDFAPMGGLTLSYVVETLPVHIIA